MADKHPRIPTKVSRSPFKNPSLQLLSFQPSNCIFQKFPVGWEKICGKMIPYSRQDQAVKTPCQK